MLFVTLGLLLGAAALLWCIVLALEFADGEIEKGRGFNAHLSPTSVKDRRTARLVFTDHHRAKIPSK